MNEEFESLLNTNIVCISEDFLKDYFLNLKPEYFKVYVYFLWKKPKKIDLSIASEELDLDEKTIETAYKFFVKKKIISKDFLKNIKTDNYVNFKEKKIEILENEKFKDILFIAEKITGDTLTERMCNVLEECYNFLKFDESLIQYLLEYCMCNTDNINANYVKTIATNWYENGIKTPEQAKQYTKQKVIKKKAIEYNTKENTINVAICNTCNDFYNSYKVLNTEYLKAQNNKKNTTDKTEKEKYNNQAVQLNGIIQKNKFDFVDNIIKEYETTTQTNKEP